MFSIRNRPIFLIRFQFNRIQPEYYSQNIPFKSKFLKMPFKFLNDFIWDKVKKIVWNRFLIVRRPNFS